MTWREYQASLFQTRRKRFPVLWKATGAFWLLWLGLTLNSRMIDVESIRWDESLIIGLALYGLGTALCRALRARLRGAHARPRCCGVDRGAGDLSW